MIRDLILIILGAYGFSSAYFYWQQYKDKKEIKKQERLNEIKTNYRIEEQTKTYYLK